MAIKTKAMTKGLYGAYKGKTMAEQTGIGTDLDVSRTNSMSGREDVCVFSLSHGVGASYISASIANYLSGCRKGKVGLVLNDIAYADEIVSPRVNVVSWENEPDVFIGSNYVVHDIGVYEELMQKKRETLQRGTKKILLCKGDGAYMTKLAAFVENEKTEDIIFLFNQLPCEWEKRAYDLVDFTKQVYCLPTFFPIKLDKQVVRQMEKMLE